MNGENQSRSTIHNMDDIKPLLVSEFMNAERPEDLPIIAGGSGPEISDARAASIYEKIGEAKSAEELMNSAVEVFLDGKYTERCDEKDPDAIFFGGVPVKPKGNLSENDKNDLKELFSFFMKKTSDFTNKGENNSEAEKKAVEKYLKNGIKGNPNQGKVSKPNNPERAVSDEFKVGNVVNVKLKKGRKGGFIAYDPNGKVVLLNGRIPKDAKEGENLSVSIDLEKPNFWSAHIIEGIKGKDDFSDAPKRIKGEEKRAGVENGKQREKIIDTEKVRKLIEVEPDKAAEEMAKYLNR